MLIVKNSKIRALICYVVPLLLIPLVVWLGASVFSPKRHVFISLAVALLSILLFVSGFEKKSVGTRRMVIVSVMIALCVVGRFIPFFKPITTITMISAMYLGAQSGFAVGAFSALLSNFYFGQGPWTPFQMLAFGLIGYVCGFLATPLKKSRAFLIFFGALCGVFYTLVMDVWTVLWYDSSFDISVYVTAFITAAPHTILYMLSNVLFLWFMAKPIGDKLERIKKKYGI